MEVKGRGGYECMFRWFATVGKSSVSLKYQRAGAAGALLHFGTNEGSVKYLKVLIYLC